MALSKKNSEKLKAYIHKMNEQLHLQAKKNANTKQNSKITK